MTKYLKYGDSNYEKNPYIEVENKDVKLHFDNKQIIKKINELIRGWSNENLTIAFDYYYGINADLIEKQIINQLNIDHKIKTDSFKKSEKETLEMINYWLTDDRIFGKMVFLPLLSFFDAKKLKKLQTKKTKPKVTLIYGVGASLLKKADYIFYFDINRWEIQLRQRAGQDNWNAKNFKEDPKRKYKRSYFIEWRSLDEHKQNIFKQIDFWIDASVDEEIKMMSGNDYRQELAKLAHKPFRLVPFFDPGVWGGQWMKEVMNLDRSQQNYAWCFDFVAEENSLNFKIQNKLFNTPAINTMLFNPVKFLGEQVFARFGAQWPIRSDLLDCVEGQNLSLHVHPTSEFIYKNFNMNFTQDESYYILGGKQNQTVYLGFKNNVNKKEFEDALVEANYHSKTFDAEKFINHWPAKTHDHYLIPAGTPHCAGQDSMVLEISGNPYIFTLRMWDWGRVDFDGKPRAIEIDKAMQNINLDFNEEYSKNVLYNKTTLLEENNKFKHEITGDSNREFFRTERYTFKKEIDLTSDGNFCLIHLVEGPSVEIYSKENKFPSFQLHYAEVMVIPAGVEKYSIKNDSDYKQKIKILKTYVKI
ncbi:class I mannose-6-phosphate isomerase [Williamsoniiplasma lucivorax]|uniref:Mannose-6-phosphate isomerase n=1 Tax=Williamsoniiplasma lucivorax TaxID=209274 RepID=A0A2S5RF15_9MOLU|nr:class I mannose-6-phosphate isomerase [Williamsoniiplasma lucivorax]PPE05919.1 mannose-6-phosphate isomerase [Williamsoniiplasma lucivorax]